MAWNIAGPNIFTTLILSLTLVWSGVRHSFAAVAPKIADVLAGFVRSTSAALNILVVGPCLWVNRCTIIPRYFAKVAALTLWAYLTGRSFVVRRPGRRPHLIARPGCKDAYVFDLDITDVNIVRLATGIHPQARSMRDWRPVHIVQDIMDFSMLFSPPLSIRNLDLASYRLIGRRWTQGHGLVGRNFCMVLVEELGRYPGAEGSISGKVFVWAGGRMAFLKIPIRFVMAPGVEETLDKEEMRIKVEWKDLEDGMCNGPNVTAYPLEWLDVAFRGMSQPPNVPDLFVDPPSCFEL